MLKCLITSKELRIQKQKADCAKTKIPRTYSTANSHQQLSHCFRVIQHDCFNGTVQHFDFLGPLLLLVFKDVLLGGKKGGVRTKNRRQKMCQRKRERERARKPLRKWSNAWGLHELKENIGLKTLFNGCLSQHSGSLPNTTMRRDLVQSNWSQSCLLPGLPLADLKRRSHLSSESKPTGLLRVGKEPHWGSPAGCRASLVSLLK